MATTSLELIGMLLCPLILSGAAWLIAVKALTWTDEISEVVRSLTQQSDSMRPVGPPKHQRGKIER